MQDSINILIVDDEPKNLTVLETVLDDPAYRLVRAESADKALLALVAEEFALLILDIRMPGMTGFELAQMIKERKKTAGVPIIFLTAYYNEDQHVLEGYGTGAVDFLHKPVNPEILRSKVAVFAELHRKNRALLAEVTERHRAEEQMRELNATLDQRVMQRTKALSDQQFYTRSLIESNVDALTTTDPRGIITDVNQQMEVLTGCTRDELIGARFKNYFTDPEKAEAGIMRVLFEKKVTNYELTARASDGKETVVSYNASTFYDRDRKLQGVIAAARDVTERKRLDQELESAKSLAEKANRAKTDFLSSMSHELRTPLNAILGFAQIMESGTPAPTLSQKQSLDQILKGGWYLLELINEILDLALIESGRAMLTREAVALGEVMTECLTMIEPQAHKRGIGLTFVPLDTCYFVNADRTRVKQVLINLLFNAIKYNKPGGTVAVECTLSAPQSLRISVRDTGMGLTAQQLEQLFQPFNRLGKEVGTEEGTGIGLMVAKRLVEQMGGTIGVDSTVNEGSVFWIELGLASAPLPTIQEAERAALLRPQRSQGVPQRTVLYVEDNPASLELVEQLLARRVDLHLLCAADGNLGIEFARTHQPEVILMDINLPGLSGIEIIQILRADPSTAHIPIIALTANALPSSIEQGLEVGFFRYLTKPINVNEFMDTLDVALEFARTQSARAAQKAPA
nr:response regulator [Rhodoferax sp.]